MERVGFAAYYSGKKRINRVNTSLILHPGENPLRPPNAQPDSKAARVPNLAYRFRQASRIIAFLVATLGLVVFCGWAFNVPALTYLRPTFQSMKVNTALLFLCLGIGLWLAHNDERKRTRRILGLLVVIIAGSTLAEYAFHVNLGIDQLLFRDTRTTSLTAYPGRMAVATAICFLLLGLAVASLGIKKAIVLQRALVGACFVVSLVALCGYLYGVNSLYAISAFSTMAVHTAAGFFAACLAYFLARPDEGIMSIAARDSSSGFLLRTLIPATIVVPIAIGWVRLAGQRANLYDTPFGVALLVLGNIGCLTVLTILIGRSMNRLEWERSRADEALVESEERFRSLYENSTLGLYRTTSDGKILLANPSLVKMLGFSSFSELAQRNLEEEGFEPGYERAEFKQRLATEGEVKGLEESWMRRDGTAIFVRESAKAIRDAEGKIAYYEGTVEDITERKQAEEALRQSEEKFLKAFRGSPMVITLSRVNDRRFIEVNDTFERLFGYRREEVIGSTVSDLRIWVDPSQWEELRNQLLSGQSHRDLELRFRTKNGRVLTCLVAAELIEVGNEPCILSVASDITARKLAEEALRTSEERFRLAALAGRMFAYEWDAATDVITRSGDFAQVLGIDEPLETTGQQILGRIHPDDREGVVTAVAALSPENPSLQISYRMQRRDGTIIWVERNSHAHFDDQGRMVRIVGMVKDVTDRKMADQELATTSERLHLAIESGSVGGWDFDLKADRNVWFGKAHAQLGMAPDESSELHQEFWAHVHEDDRERLENALQVAKDRHKEFAEEFRVVWRDGTIHWLRSRGRYHYAANGDPERMLGISLDITQSKQAEEALRESEQRLRLATQAGRMYAYDWNVTTNVVLRSSEHVKILGLAEPLCFPHQQFVDKIHPDDRPKFLAAITGLTLENPTGEVTYRVPASDGSLVWLKSNGRGFFDAEGKLLRVIGMVADVTDQKLAEESLRDSEERLRLAQKVARIGSFERNIRTGVNTWTPEMESMYGLPPGGFGQTRTAFENLVHHDDRAEVVKLVDEALKTGQQMSGEWRVIWPDGSVRWIAGRWQVLMDESGEPSRVVGVNMDVTDRKRSEEALWEMNRTLEAQGSLLRSREELLSVFVKNVPAAVAMLDRDMRYLQVSDRWCSDYLQGRAQILGNSHYEIFPDMPERWKEVHRRALQGETLRADEDRWDGQDGTHWARWEVRPWKTAEGAVGGILILTEDITRRKQMEETLSGMTRKLVEGQEQERARIARELHDDISQRLALLITELEHIREKHKELPPDVHREILELQQMTADLCSNVYGLSHELHSSTLDLLGLSKGMASWCRAFGERQNMEIVFNSHDVPELPQETSLCLFRVLQEAVHNAAKHSGVKRIDVQLAGNSSAIHLTVSDTGKGFDIEAARQRRGLGLTSMQERVRLIGGTFAIESKPTLGTTIQVRVPLNSERPSQWAAAV